MQGATHHHIRRREMASVRIVRYHLAVPQTQACGTTRGLRTVGRGVADGDTRPCPRRPLRLEYEHTESRSRDVDSPGAPQRRCARTGIDVGQHSRCGRESEPERHGRRVGGNGRESHVGSAGTCPVGQVGDAGLPGSDIDTEISDLPIDIGDIIREPVNLARQCVQRTVHLNREDGRDIARTAGQRDTG